MTRMIGIAWLSLPTRRLDPTQTASPPSFLTFPPSGQRLTINLRLLKLARAGQPVASDYPAETLTCYPANSRPDVIQFVLLQSQRRRRRWYRITASPPQAAHRATALIIAG